MREPLATALRCAAKGIPVFPCTGKIPMVRWRELASTNPTQLRTWLGFRTDLNLGMPTGARSGVVVIDVDVKKIDGVATMKSLQRDLGELPRTATVQTPSGGWHLYFRSGACATIRNAAGKIAGEDAPGVDVRGEGGYVLIPPSAIDRPYRWHRSDPPAELPEAWARALVPPTRIVPSPAWSPENMRDRDRVHRWCVEALRTEAEDLAATPLGRRNDELWKSGAALAGLVHLGAFASSDVRGALLAACATWGADSSPRKDADTLERAIAFGLAHPRTVNLGEPRRVA